MLRTLARTLRAWLACTLLALTCAPPATASARALVVMVAEASAEREELPCEQRQLEPLPVSVPVRLQNATTVRERGLRRRVRHAPPLYLEHCALLL